MTWRELSDEAKAHIEEKALGLIEAGVPESEAWAQARRDFGNTTCIIESSREVWTRGWVEQFLQDVRYGVRVLRRSPLFTLTAVLSLAIGIGGNTAIFTVVDALLLRPPTGVVHPAELVDIGRMRGDGGLNPISTKLLEEIKLRTQTLAEVSGAGMFPHALSVARSGEFTTQTIVGLDVSLEFFSVLGATPSLGRLFNANEANEAVVVLNHNCWTRLFGASPSVVGQTVRMNGRAFIVIGVTQPEFEGAGMVPVDAWIPLERGVGASVLLTGRLKEGTSVNQAAAEMALIGASTSDPQNVSTKADGLPQPASPLSALRSSRAGANRNLIGGFAGGLMLLVSLLLTVACANIASITLARSTSRAKEMAVRASLGASRARLLRQLLTETVVLFLLGGLLGLLLAEGLVATISRIPWLPFPVNVPLQLDASVIRFTTLLSLSAALLSGFVPAFKGSNTNPYEAMKDVATSSLHGSRLRSAFVVGQVAISLFLIMVSVTMLRVMRHAGSFDPGYDPRGVEVAGLDLSTGAFTDETRPLFWQNTIRQTRDSPDVEAASIAATPPGGFEGISLGIVNLPGRAPAEAYIPAWNIVDSGYFQTLRIPIVAGRDFSESDSSGTQSVAIVGEGIARRFWPGKNATGEFLEVSDLGPKGVVKRNVLIIGVAKDIHSTSLVDGLAESYLYLPLRQTVNDLFTTRMSILARSRSGRRLTAELTSVVHDLNPNLAVVRSSTVEESIAFGLAPQRVVTNVAGALGVIGVLLASIGIYGITAYTVARRNREFGIRMALGAPRATLLFMALRHGLSLTLIGSLVGLVLASVVSIGLASFLYGLPPFHWPTLVAGGLLFVGIGLIASFLPARRVSALDPLRSLRLE